ncbi:MAG: hypothetical protein R3222_09925 [Balneolaceae bacterium]|nr:hypothetical protein [Balneolaceae bacterium]
MYGYTEVLQTIAAMLIFSLILLNSNRMIQRNTIMQLEGDLEQQVIAHAQNLISESRTKDFDEESIAFVPITIPDDFTAPGALGPESGESGRTSFDDFDDYNGWSETLFQGTDQMFTVSTEVYYVDSNFDSTGVRTAFKQIDVQVTSPYLTVGNGQERVYEFNFVRNYYAD